MIDFENLNYKKLSQKLKEYKENDEMVYDFMAEIAYEKLKKLTADGHCHINMRVSGYENIKSILNHTYVKEDDGFKRQRDYIDSPHTKFKGVENARIVYTFAFEHDLDENNLSDFMKKRCRAIQVIDEVRAQNAPSSFRMESEYNYERILFVVMPNEDIKKFEDNVSYANSQYCLTANCAKNVTYKECAFNVSDKDPLENARMFDMPNLVLKLKLTDLTNINELRDFVENASGIQEEFINKVISEFDINKAKENGYKLSRDQIASTICQNKDYKWGEEEFMMLEGVARLNLDEIPQYLRELSDPNFLSFMITDQGLTPKVVGALNDNDFFNMEDETDKKFLDCYKSALDKVQKNTMSSDDDCM